MYKKRGRKSDEVKLLCGKKRTNRSPVKEKEKARERRGEERRSEKRKKEKMKRRKALPPRRPPGVPCRQ